MPETVKSEYQAKPQNKKVPGNKLGPVKTGSGGTRWATDSNTRGKRASDGPKSWPSESTLKSFTKLPNLKRR